MRIFITAISIFASSAIATADSRVYEPLAKSEQCAPLLVISHGAGGNNMSMRYLASGMAAEGWRVAVLSHPESGTAALADLVRDKGMEPALSAMVMDPAAFSARFRDIMELLATLPCSPKVKLLAGHSMGAMTALMEAGAPSVHGIKGKNRFDGYIALSPRGEGVIFPEGSFARLKMPILMVTGTRDIALNGDWTTRVAAFRALPATDNKRLAIIKDADHMAFSGRGNNPLAETQTLELVKEFARQVRSGKFPHSKVVGPDIREK